MNVCVYHEDWDGLASANLVRIYCEGEFEAFPVNYGHDTEIKRKLRNIAKRAHIWIVDYSFDAETMHELSELADDFTWIDHHITNEKLAKEMLARGLDVVFDTAQAACVLTYKRLRPANIYMPDVVELIGIYDIWNTNGTNRWTWNDAVNFQFFLKSRPLRFSSLIDLETADIHECLRIGAYIRQAFANEFIQGAFEVEAHLAGRDWKLICLNKSFHSIANFDFEKYDAVVIFFWNKNIWQFSIYDPSKRNDVSEIARLYGGGGHKHAAGWQSKELPEWLKCVIFGK